MSFSSKPCHYYHKYENLILFAFICVLAALAFNTAHDYGVTWDESLQRDLAVVNYDYLTGNNTDLLSYKDKDYGIAFELPLYMFERILLEDPNHYQVYILRHLLIHLFFLIGIFFFYKLIRFQYKSSLLAWIGIISLILSPRIYGHSFFNSKDIPFMVISIIYLYYLTKAFDENRKTYYIFLGIACGLSINMRIMGVLFFSIAQALIIMEYAYKTRPRKNIINNQILFTVSATISLIFLWPYLWPDPFNNFVDAFTNMSKFRWNGSVLYNGERILATKLPWHYSLTWYGITTPPIYILFSIAGIVLVLFKFTLNPSAILHDTNYRSNIVFLGVCASPILATIYLQSVLYDGWRQLYFIYPSSLLLMLYFISEAKNYLIRKKHTKTLMLLLCIILTQWILVLQSQYTLHPFHNLYFNKVFISHKKGSIAENWQYDYWGASYKPAIEWLDNNYPEGNFNLCVTPRGPGGLNIRFPVEFNIKVFSKRGFTDRFTLVDNMNNDTDFLMTNYRLNTPNTIKTLLPPNAEEIYQLTLQSSRVISIYKLNM